MKAFPRDIDIKTLTERHVGIESELVVRHGDGDSLHPALSKNGILRSIGWDGGGREFRTNPISVKSLLKQVKGRKYVTEYYQHLKEHTVVTAQGGTHIHISILDKDNENMESNATAIATAFYDQFQKISGRRSTWARKLDFGNTIEECRRYCDERKSDPSGDQRVYIMKGSMLAPTAHKTLEFRGGVGSNNIEDILPWVEFLNNVVKAANRKNIDGLKFSDLLKGEHIAEYAKGLKDWRELSKKDLNQTVNVKALA